MEAGSIDVLPGTQSGSTLKRLLVEATALGATFRLSGARVALGGTPLPESLKTAIRAHRADLWAHLGGARLDAAVLELAQNLGIAPVMVQSMEEAVVALRELDADAARMNGTIGLDIETAPRPSFAKLRPPTRLRGDGAQTTHQPTADDPAGLDPFRATIMTVQLYAGGPRAFVFPAAFHDMLWKHGLRDRHLVIHNAKFELRFLRHYGIGFPANFECTMQAAGLMLGVHRRSLADTCAAYLNVVVPKDLQTSDWAAVELSPGQIAYAAADAILVWHLWQALEPELVTHGRWAAYELQRNVIPAVVDMELRGLGIDLDEHAKQTEQWACDLADSRRNYVALTGKPPPTKPADIRSWLASVLPEGELAGWPRTEKGQELSTRRTDLVRAAHLPSTRPVLDIIATEKLLSSFGHSLRGEVNPVTGRLHASYNIAAAKSGRFTANTPNLQQLPSGKAPLFKRCFVPAAGHVLVGCDWSQIEMRGAAWISGDPALTQVYVDGHDLQ